MIAKMSYNKGLEVELGMEEIERLESKILTAAVQIKNGHIRVIKRPLEVRVIKMENRSLFKLHGNPKDIPFSDAASYLLLISREAYRYLKYDGEVSDILKGYNKNHGVPKNIDVYVSGMRRTR